jgi:hypothetical protein
MRRGSALKAFGVAPARDGGARGFPLGPPGNSLERHGECGRRPSQVVFKTILTTFQNLSMKMITENDCQGKSTTYTNFADHGRRFTPATAT